MNNLRKHLKFTNLKRFSEVVASACTSAPAVATKPSEILAEIKRTQLNLSPDEFSVARKTGSDLYLNPEKLRTVQNAGLFFNDVNDELDLEKIAVKGWKLQYLKNMLLLQDYTNIFREFLQSCALNNSEGLGLTCEPRFNNFVQSNLHAINKLGYNLEIESLRIKQDFSILRMEIYKNLKVNRFENRQLNNYKFDKIWTPLGNLVVAKELGRDTSLPTNPTPFILATTMLVRTPMKIAFMNQNMSRKVHGQPEEKTIDYVVRFESQFTYNDFFWVMPVQNKPKRIRSTKIADFNTVMRGNPFFESNFDLVDENMRFNYMVRNQTADNKIRTFISSL